MHDVVISGNVVNELGMSPSELMIELAVYLYDKGKLSMGQAKKLADLTQIEFQKELSKRGVCIKYNIEDLEKDLENIGLLD